MVVFREVLTDKAMPGPGPGGWPSPQVGFRLHDVCAVRALTATGCRFDLDLCPDCHTRLIRAEGCRSCPSCGYSACS